MVGVNERRKSEEKEQANKFSVFFLVEVDENSVVIATSVVWINARNYDRYGANFIDLEK